MSGAPALQRGVKRVSFCCVKRQVVCSQLSSKLKSRLSSNKDPQINKRNERKVSKQRLWYTTTKHRLFFRRKVFYEEKNMVVNLILRTFIWRLNIDIERSYLLYCFGCDTIFEKQSYSKGL